VFQQHDPTRFGMDCPNDSRQTSLERLLQTRRKIGSLGRRPQSLHLGRQWSRFSRRGPVGSRLILLVHILSHGNIQQRKRPGAGRNGFNPVKIPGQTAAKYVGGGRSAALNSHGQMS
jgi:hypothetical protein